MIDPDDLELPFSNECVRDLTPTLAYEENEINE